MTFSINFDHFRSFTEHKSHLFQKFIEKRSKTTHFNQNLFEINWKFTSLFNWNLILMLKSELSLNHHPNLDGLVSESSTIWFWTPNRLSLIIACKFNLTLLIQISGIGIYELISDEMFGQTEQAGQIPIHLFLSPFDIYLLCDDVDYIVHWFDSTAFNVARVLNILNEKIIIWFELNVRRFSAENSFYSLFHTRLFSVIRDDLHSKIVQIKYCFV